MLTLVYGIDWTANRNYIMELLAQDVAQRKPQRILLVPELISHETERRLCRVAGDTCSRYAEVLSFSRLTKRICDWAGCGMDDCMDNGGRVVAMAAAARQLHGQLKSYASLETNPEFLSGLIDAVDEFKRCCITPKDLSAASAQTQGVFAQKLEEISLLMDAYNAICAQGKLDPRDQLTWGLEQLYNCDFAQNHVFYIDGFPDFTVQNMAVISYLIENAPHVIISLNCDKPSSDMLAFSKAGDTAGKILRIAQQLSVNVVLKEIVATTSKMLPVCNQLFQGKISKTPELAISTVQASSIYDECVLAADHILKLIQNGVRYRDISLVCNDLTTYQNALTMHLSLCAIPYYVAGKEDILEKPVISTVLSALDAALGGFETKHVLRYLKSALSPLSLEECDQLENYAVLWSIEGKKWNNDWTMHPEGLVDEWSQSHKTWLASINLYRKAAISPLMNLAKCFRDATCLSHQIQGITAFFEEINLQDRLSQLALELDIEGDNRSAQILSQLWEILVTALEQMEDTLGQTHWDNESFTRLFRLLLSQYDVGTIPPVLDTLTIGPVSAMRCQQVKHLVVIGASEGSFPGYGMTSGILTDQERKELRQLGVPLTGGASEGLEIEFSEIYSTFCGTSESIYLSCQEGQTSFVFRRIDEMAGSRSHCNDGYSLGATAVNPAEAAAYLCRNRLEAPAYELGLENQYRTMEQSAGYEMGNISPEAIEGLYGKKLNLSASQIDKLADCRLAYFLKYGLRTKEQKPVTVDPAEFGTYVHYVLENTARQIHDRGGFKAVSLEETMETAQKYAEEYADAHFSQIDSQRLKYLFQRNNRELMMIVEELWEEFQHSSFIAHDFEVAFGEHMQMPAIPINGSKMSAQLRGFVDRVDIWNNGGCNYFKVVDYKTGKKDFDYCDVFNGLGLQLLLYLFALERSGEELLGDNPIPAGVQYFPARVPVMSVDGILTEAEVEKERKAHWKRKGLILHDEDVLSAMDDTDDQFRLCCKTKKDGTITGDIADREQFKLLNAYVFRLLGNMVDDIASGNVVPNPYTRGNSHNACRFCPYGSVCHSASVSDRRNYKTMSSQRFWDEITKEMSGHE